MFVIDYYPFTNLLLEIPRLHVNFFIILHNFEAFAKCLLQLLKNAIGVINLVQSFHPTPKCCFVE